jgi:adenylate cyclase
MTDGEATSAGTLTPQAPAGPAPAPPRPLPAHEAVTDRALREPGSAIARRLWWPFGAAVGGAHLVGAVAVFVLLTYLLPTADGTAVTGGELTAFLLFMSVGWPLGALISHLLWKPISRWLVADRPPTEREIRLTLHQPLHQALGGGLIWLAGTAYFTLYTPEETTAEAIRVGTVIFDAGIVTCSLSYLLTERVLRPVTARALAFGMPDRCLALPGVRTRVMLAWVFGTGVLLADMLLVGGLVLIGSPATVDQLAETIVVLSLLGALIGLASITAAARSVADPIDSVRRAMEAVERGEIDVEAPVYDASEVGRLQAGFNRMVAGLREREQLQDLFGRHVGEDVARLALGRGLSLGGETREAAVLFVDLLGSTAMAVSRDATSVVATLNRFFGMVVEEASLRGGWVNKFEGDAALCVFGAPTGHPDAAAGALATGRALRERLARELPEAQAAIGLSAGTVVAGNVGAAERFEYTVIGDPVNEAARLTELAKTTRSRLLASEAIVSAAGSAEADHWRLGETVTLRGRGRPTRRATAR